ncbi:hypothetical protein RRG08_047419 [Elysia crispata]|uniref:Uncharacterized protein n=1 Tax=Elysia crispata TaxID=231223 RepID=A0AAE1D5I9_9GAST|nr:hypothetical protein RRG08_047419 [Elysia crispata]
MAAPPLTLSTQKTDLAGAVVCPCRAKLDIDMTFPLHPSRAQTASRTMTGSYRTVIGRRDRKVRESYPACQLLFTTPFSSVCLGWTAARPRKQGLTTNILI